MSELSRIISHDTVRCDDLQTQINELKAQNASLIRQNETLLDLLHEKFKPIKKSFSLSSLTRSISSKSSSYNSLDDPLNETLYNGRPRGARVHA